MPKNYKTGTPSKKTKVCPIPDCDYRARKSGLNLHVQEIHGYESLYEYYRQYFLGRGLLDMNEYTSQSQRRRINGA